MKEFAGIVLIVGYHFQIVVRSVIERFPAILPSMSWVKNPATSLDLYKTGFCVSFGFIDSRRAWLYRIGALALYLKKKK